jgi:hypothetical protein
MGLMLLALLLGGTDSGTERSAVVAGSECDNAQTRELVGGFRDQLKARLGPALLSEEETAAPLGGVGTRTLPDLKRAFTRARESFFAGRTPRALQELISIEEDAGRLRPSEERWGFVRQVLAARAQVELKADPPAGRKTLRRLVSTEPTFEPPRDEYPPSYLKELATARAAVSALGTNRLDIRVDPAGKAVFVGGRPAGTAPASLRMAPGDYVVEADFGRRAVGRVVTVPRPSDLPNAVSLSERVEGSIDPSGGPCISVGGHWEPLGRVMDLLKVDRLLILKPDHAASAPTLSVTEYDRRSRTELREQKVPLGGAKGQPVKELASRVAP